MDGLDTAARIARDSPWLAAFAPLPVLGDQIDALREVTEDAARIGAVAGDAVAEIDAAAKATTDGPSRLALLDLAASHLTEVEAVLAGATVEDRRLLPPIGAAVQEFEDEVAERLEDVREAQGRVATIHRLLAGPGRYLVLGGNNAEMSGSVGMPLTAGVLHLEGGELELSEFEPTSDLLSLGGPPLDENLIRLYAQQGFYYDFRGTTATPNFPFVGPIMADMSSRVATGPVDGVFLIDTMAVGALIDATGPITVRGETYDANEALYQLLVGNYERFGDPSVREQRIEAQGEYASAVFDNLNSGEASLGALASVLGDLARGRHVLAWSADPELQALWEDIGADGAVGPRSLAVSVENMDGNKLDTVIKPRIELDTVRLPNDVFQAELVLSITNPDRDDLPPLVIGNGPEIHFTQVVLHLPEGSTAVQVVEAPERVFQAEGTDTDSVVVTALYGTYVGETSRYHIRFKFPAGLEEIEVVPSARYLGSEYDVNGIEFLDRLPRTVPLEPPGGSGLTGSELAVAGVGGVAALGAGVAAVAARRRLRRLA